MQSQDTLSNISDPYATDEDPYATDEESNYQPSSSSDSEVEEDRVDLVGKKGRKRIRMEENWQCNTRKSRKASGKEYINVRGQNVPAKVFHDPVCKCGKKCSEAIEVEQCKKLFENFYNLGSFDLQSSYIYGQVDVIKKIRFYTENEESRSSMTRIYKLPNENGSNVKVCKKYFKQVLQISDGRISRVLLKKSEGIPPIDQRGKHPSARKTPDAKVQEVKDFIEKFPVYESHYSRAKSGERKYLAPSLNMQILYNLYKKKYASPVSNYVFKNIFNTHFSLHFHAPITDSCRKCDELDIKLKISSNEEKTNLETEKDLHLLKADLASNEMKIDGEEASVKENETVAIAFDLMKTLPTPVLSTGITYYKRQLWTYCLGVHDLAANTAVMYVWNESVASRGPQEIGSCLIHYCKNFVSERKLIMYSDQCGCQNCNIKMALICDYITSSTQFSITEINHKFLVSCHSYLPCDQDFGIVEKEKKFHKEVFIPEHWMTVIKSARKRKPFQVVEMTENEYFSTKKLEDVITNRKAASDGSKVEWMKFQWIKFSGDTKHQFDFKYSNSKTVPFKTVSVAKRNACATVEELDLLYPLGRPIEKKKKADLLELLPYIPPIYHNFYHKLKTSATALDELGDEHIENADG